MNLVEYDGRDGKKVWLDETEVRMLLEKATGTEERICLLLGVRSGLRRSEIVKVTPRDVVSTSAGPRVRVREGKGDTFRETPAPDELLDKAQVIADLSDRDTPMVDRSTRWVSRRVQNIADEIIEETGDEGWSHLRPHDLRRTWATQLSGRDVDPILVCQWGGWDDLRTFLEHYRGIYSPQVQRQQLEKVPWMNVRESEERDDPVSIFPDEIESESRLSS